jgi:hypothetical protein
MIEIFRAGVGFLLRIILLPNVDLAGTDAGHGDDDAEQR